jgi:hypothetical protein
MLRTRSGRCNSPFNGQQAFLLHYRRDASGRVLSRHQWCVAARSPSVLPVVLSRKCSDMHAGHDTGM